MIRVVPTPAQILLTLLMLLTCFITWAAWALLFPRHRVALFLQVQASSDFSRPAHRSERACRALLHLVFHHLEGMLPVCAAKSVRFKPEVSYMWYFALLAEEEEEEEQEVAWAELLLTGLTWAPQRLQFYQRWLTILHEENKNNSSVGFSKDNISSVQTVFACHWVSPFHTRNHELFTTSFAS